MEHKSIKTCENYEEKGNKDINRVIELTLGPKAIPAGIGSAHIESSTKI